MSSFDTARDLRLPGVVIGDVFIDPKQLSQRMKNMAKEMLRSGVLKGGWSSKSKQLAKKIAERTDVLLVNSTSRGFYAPARHTYSDVIAEEVCALIDADMGLELMDDHARYNNLAHLESIVGRTRDRHDDARRVVLTALPYRWCWMFSSELAHQAAALFTSARTPAQLEAAEKLCDMLDNNTPIPITLSM